MKGVSVLLVATLGAVIILLAAQSSATALATSGSYFLQSSAGGGHHLVQKGETLSGIALRYGVSLAALKQANGLTGDLILVGQTLRIPSAHFDSPLAPPQAASSTSLGNCTNPYFVRRGDSLSAIASRCGVSIAAIKVANNMSGNVLYVGQMIKIPSSGYSPKPVTALPAPRPTATATPPPAIPPWTYPARP